MPCNSGYTYSDGVNEYLGQLNALTRLVCRLLKKLEKDGLTSYIDGDPALREWWTEHQEIDRERKAEDARNTKERRDRRRAMDKLTDEEKKLLRLD